MIKVHVSAENRYNICIISTKGVLFSPVSICLMVGWLAAGLDKNYGTDFNETWMKFVSPNKSLLCIQIKGTYLTDPGALAEVCAILSAILVVNFMVKLGGEC